MVQASAGSPRDSYEQLDKREPGGAVQGSGEYVLSSYGLYCLCATEGRMRTSCAVPVGANRQ